MTRRSLLALGRAPAALAAAGQAPAQPAPKAGPPPSRLFQGDPDFSFETQRLFGGADYVHIHGRLNETLA